MAKLPSLNRRRDRPGGTDSAGAHAAGRPGPLIYATDGGQLVSLPPTPNATPFPILETGAYKYSTPDVSPDGKTVLYVASDFRIRTIPIGGGEPTTVYTPVGENPYTDLPVWRPDGKAYAFTRYVSDVGHEIVIRTLSGEQEETIAYPGRRLRLTHRLGTRSGEGGARWPWGPRRPAPPSRAPRCAPAGSRCPG